ncbi:MAG TPA: CoA transferase, partial [Candidatus Acidoferrales bacterium]|nr:CoA transferase [Candidatus Acidoferrales bacterium]
MSTPSALERLRVIDLTDVSGAYCGKLLADMGAEVILIEPPGGSAMRKMEPYWNDSDGSSHSLVFAHYNTNKQSVVIDVQSPDERQTLQRLMGTSDVVIESYRPGDLERLGLSFDSLHQINPRLIWVSITPFGQTGPYRQYRSRDLVCQAMGGMAFLNGAADQAPLAGAGRQGCHCAALQAAITILAALLARERNGEGRHIDISIQECVVASVEHATTSFRRTGSVMQRQGSLHWTGDFRVARAADGHVMLSTLGDWTTLSNWVAESDSNTNLIASHWNSEAYRREHKQALFDALEAWAARHSRDSLVEAAQLRRLPFGAVRSLQEIANDKQLASRNFFVPVVHDELQTTLKYPGAPYVFSRTPWRIARRAPLLGEHTSEVLDGIQFRDVQKTSTLTTEAHGQPLSGVRVIDFTWAVAGPVATRILADLGAEVIKIERPGSAPREYRQRSAHGDLNRGKQSVSIDLSRPEGRELVGRLIAIADVVVDNFSTRVMANWGFDHEALSRMRRDIISVSMSAFGLTGPRSNHVAYGPTLQAEAGYNSLMCDAHGEPVGWGFSYSDVVAGWSGALATLFAVWHRRQTGEGQNIDLSQFESLVALHGAPLLEVINAAGSFAASGRQALGKPPAALAAILRCADSSAGATAQWCAIDIRDEPGWQRLCKAIAAPAWTKERRFGSIVNRIEHASALIKLLEAWTRQRSAGDVMRLLQQAGIAAGVVQSAEDLC